MCLIMKKDVFLWVFNFYSINNFIIIIFIIIIMAENVTAILSPRLEYVLWLSLMTIHDMLTISVLKTETLHL